MSEADLAPWLIKRAATRRQIADEILSDGAFKLALEHHDRTVCAVVNAQRSIQDYIDAHDALTEQQTDWLCALAVICQSLDVPRNLILDAAYTAATSLLKQEWDGINMLAGIKKGSPRYGKSPNLKNTLGDFPNRRHRLLQPVAHLSGENLGRAFATRDKDGLGEFYPHPLIQSEVAKRLLHERTYLLGHLFLEMEAFLGPIKEAETQGCVVDAMNYLAKIPAW